MSLCFADAEAHAFRRFRGSGVTAAARPGSRPPALPKRVMLTYAAKRLGLAVAVVAVVIAVLFLMIYIIPGDPLTVALGPRANPALVEALRQRMGLDQALLYPAAALLQLRAHRQSRQ